MHTLVEHDVSDPAAPVGTRGAGPSGTPVSDETDEILVPQRIVLEWFAADVA